MKERFKQIREWSKLTKKEFGEKIGIKGKTIENIEDGRQRVNEEHIEAIIKHYPFFVYWLVTGKTLEEVGQIKPKKTPNN